MLDRRRIVLATLFGGRIPHVAVVACAVALAGATVCGMVVEEGVAHAVVLAVAVGSIVGIVILSRVLPYDECDDVREALELPETGAEARRVAHRARIVGLVIVGAVLVLMAWATITHRVSPFVLLYALS